MSVPVANLIDFGQPMQRQQVHQTPAYENHEITGIEIKAGTICIGEYDFNASNKGDLAFKKGETLTIIQPTKDANWFKARNATGQSGMVPRNYLARKSESQTKQELLSSQTNMNSKRTSNNNINQNHKEVKLHAMPWFHGKITRQQAEILLRPPKDGLFLVRESTNYPGDYTMCVCCAGQVEHYRIIFTDNKVTIDEEEYFENLSQLVEHYKKDADGLVCALTSPLLKQGGLDYSVDMNDFQKAGWAIKLSAIEFGEKIGKGEFGDVFVGEYNCKKVAIKSVKDKSKAAQAFLAEASVMTKLNHKNLVQLLGVVIPQNNQKTNEPIYVVLEFMEKGALLEYLRSRGRSMLKEKDLLGFAKDVAAGMAYVETKQLVHRDLAARNILVSEQGVAKVSDFGLARSTEANLQGGKFPVKWTAPEALKESKFSNKSDVWSYGIMLWEIWSFGRVPYPKIALKDVLKRVNDGYRMEKPNQCSEGVYQLMKKCWQIDPVQRLSFAQVVRELSNIHLDVQ